jgi:hypothetical protein
MGEKGRLLCLALLATAVVAIGCGDDASTGAGLEETTSEERLYPKITGPTREFLVEGGDNIVQTYGEEASAAEREKASRVIHAWMEARVAKDWATDCKYFGKEYRENLVEDANGVTKGRVKDCPSALEFFGAAASGTSGNTLTGPIDSLRVREAVEGSGELNAFAQWHGPEHDWILPLTRENGVWRVTSASPLDRNK